MPKITIPDLALIQERISEAQRKLEFARTTTVLELAESAMRSAASSLSNASALCDRSSDELGGHDCEMAEIADRIRAEG